MTPLADRLAAQHSLLSPLAVPLIGRLGRAYPDGEDDTRGPFQRARDRIFHSQAFRRLLGKTQLFVAGEGDHYRTRLTHTLEVAQIARDIARTLLLNEDLAECIALTHDLGHPPFGHSGEEAIHAWLQQHGMEFEHNQQSHRIVTILEQHSTHYPGLNLNLEVLTGILKHTRPAVDGRTLNHTLEAQVVNMADEIAYMSADCDDGLRAGLFSQKDLATTVVGKRAVDKAKQKGSQIRGAILDQLVDDLYAASTAAIAQSGVSTLEDVENCPETLIRLSSAMRGELDELRRFTWENVITHPLVRSKVQPGQRLVAALCEALYRHPTDKVQSLMARTGSSLEEAVKDWVAGMTDDFARLQAAELGIDLE